MFSKNIFKNIKKIKLFSKNNFFFYFLLFVLFIFIFWLVVYTDQGIKVANQKIIYFLTSYFLEILLSIDNVFAWFFIFKSLKIPLIYQKKVLLYGLWGALILRSIFSFSGSFLFSKWHWILYLFGGFFILTSLKFIFFSNLECDNKEENIKKLWIYKFFRVTENINNENFFVKIEKKIFITPLFVSLILIELSDIVFSVDSIPAALSVNNDLFIIFSSNFFAVLGLRSMYLFTAYFLKNFPIMKYALSLILMFIGFKILIEKFFTFSIFLTLAVILIILITTFLINLIFNLKKC
ncbi:TerC family protein [Buchnera aphidicola]|jgi:TerC family integral membrane protein|nr:TerC family protein [Buchnera aphidicola]